MTNFRYFQAGSAVKINILLIIFAPYFYCGCGRTVLPATTITKNCLPLHSSPSEKSALAGMLILPTGDVYRLEGNKIINDHLPRKEDKDYIVINYDIFVSPDQQMVLYDNHYFDRTTKKFIDRELLLLSRDGTTKPVLGWEPAAPFVIRGWRGNNWLELKNSQGKIVLLNPNTGEIRRVSLELPDLVPGWLESEYPLPVLDPNITRAAYTRASDSIQFALYDIENRKLLWTRDNRVPKNEPQWSVDGETLVVAVPTIDLVGFELFSIDRAGKETQLTTIGDKYKNVRMDRIKISPNNRYIAFGLDYDEDQYYLGKIAVMDISKGRIFDYCLGTLLGEPIWSSDSRYLAVGIADDEKINTYRLVIVDMKTEYAFAIDPSLDPVGWLD